MIKPGDLYIYNPDRKNNRYYYSFMVVGVSPGAEPIIWALCFETMHIFEHSIAAIRHDIMSEHFLVIE